MARMVAGAPRLNDHPSDEAGLRAHVLGEKRRIAGLSRIRELVLGFQDGLLVPLGVVTGLAGATATTTTIIVGGLAETAAGALAMGTGAFLASQAENHLYAAEIADETAEYAHHPEIERAELALLLREEGLSAEDAETASTLIASSEHAFLKTMVEKELGIPYDEGETAVGDAFVVGCSYAVAALIPLWPYFFFAVHVAIWVSIAATVVGLFALGVLKGRVARSAIIRSGLQVAVIGGLSAGIGYVIGVVVPKLIEH